MPKEYRGATPYLIVKGAARAIEFYQQALDAKETMRLPMPDGRIGHAELMIGGGPVMLADEFPEMGAQGPESFGGSPVSLLVYVEDADAVVDRAVAAGATLLRPVKDQFYGDRSGMVVDPFGHRWAIATHKEDVSPEEMQRRSDAAMQQAGKQ
jgi:PhnB protein